MINIIVRTDRLAQLLEVGGCVTVIKAYSERHFLFL